MQPLLKFLHSLSSERLFDSVKRGVEKENLRVTSSGEISQQSHPQALGAALTNAWITTDFSEALVEVVTPPQTKLKTIYDQLTQVSKYVAQHIGKELIWCSSMPVELGDQMSVPLARYGESNIGRLKTLYRRGLCHRYGRAMQVIAGIHYNFSFPGELLALLNQYQGTELSLQNYANESYMQLVRNCLRYAWLIPYLFGASPACANSSLIMPVDYVEVMANGDVIAPYATSLRLSDLGYQNKGQELLKVCYRNVESYAESLTRATRRPFTEFSEINQSSKSLVQLNDSLLQIANEFYSPVRPKQIAYPCEQPMDALLKRGVAYVEMRMLDLNPLQTIGVCPQQMAFMDVFLTYCLLKSGEPFTSKRYAEYKANLKAVACCGRRPNLMLSIGNKSVPFKEAAKQVFADLYQVAEVLDHSVTTAQYAEVVEAQYRKLDDIDLTPSAQLLAEMKDSQLSFQEFFLEKSRHYTKQLQKEQPAMQTELEQEARRSLEEFAAIEAEPQEPFDAFLARYLHGCPSEDIT